MIRFNHVELTVPVGFVVAHEAQLESFFVDIFGFRRSVFPGLEIPSLVFVTDTSSSQFIFIAEHEQPAAKMSDDHLGFHLDDDVAVEKILALCVARQRDDDRLEIRDFGVLDLEATTTRAFYVRYLLPIWFDVQHIGYKAGYEQSHTWRFMQADLHDMSGRQFRKKIEV